MEQIARICFPAAKRVTDRFHVQKLAYEAVQEMRVKARWEALDEESPQIAYAKACGKMYHAPVFANGDTRKHLLARSIYLLYKKESLWTLSQRIRAEILFKEYPDIKKGYYLSMRLGLIYHQCKFKDIALTKAMWAVCPACLPAESCTPAAITSCTAAGAPWNRMMIPCRKS